MGGWGVVFIVQNFSLLPSLVLIAEYWEKHLVFLAVARGLLLNW